VTGGDRIRLFCALRLPEAALDAIVRWQAEALSSGRAVPRQNLHVTLAFLGGRPAADVAGIAGELRAAAARAGPMRLHAVRYRETRSVGMVVLEDVTGAGAALAADLGERLEQLGVYRREQRPWLPHVTVLRFSERPRLRPELPALGELVPSDAAVYVSELRPGGARYEALETAPLETTRW
jgi:RNA 2',3'-cyclic 3'-phosphodiesterase